MYFPNRDELSFRVVFALPKASMIGLLAKICLSVSLIPSSPTTLPLDTVDEPDALSRFRCAAAGLEGSSTDAK